MLAFSLRSTISLISIFNDGMSLKGDTWKKLKPNFIQNLLVYYHTKFVKHVLTISECQEVVNDSLNPFPYYKKNDLRNLIFNPYCWVSPQVQVSCLFLKNVIFFKLLYTWIMNVESSVGG